MLPHSGVSAPTLGTASILPVDIRRLPWMRRLAVDYAFDYGRLAEFYSGNPAEPAAWRAAIAQAQQHARPRDAVASMIQAQQRGRGAPAEALAASAHLEDPRTVAIVTGQQAGLFGGPLFTLLKALSAVRLAEEVREQYHVPAVAVFWIDAEDHDWDEVKRCAVLDADLQPRSVDMGDPPGAHSTPVARVQLDASVSAALDALGTTLPETEFRAELLSRLRRAYQPGVGMADAFARWIESLLGPRGLIVYDSADVASKPLVRDLFVREVEHAGDTARLAGRAGVMLEERGYHAQAVPQEGSVALFHLNSGRDTIRIQEPGMFQLGTRVVSTAELVEHVRRSPEEFSPNVLLRPLVQDSLFPTVCYVSGPSELAYLGQLKDVYLAFGIPMPLIRPRGTATLVDANAMRFLTRHELPLEELRARDEAALNELLSAQLPPGVDVALTEAGRAIELQMAAVAEAVTQIDATLEGAARSTLSRMQEDLKKLQSKVIQAAKRKDDTLRRQFTHAQAQAFPGGQPQEREVAFVYFLDKYGPALLDRVSEVMPGEMGTHYVMTV